MDAHLPILKSITDLIVCESIFEYGLGSNYKTSYISDKFQEVTTVDMRDEIPENDNREKKYSCIVIDGHNAWEYINRSFSKTDVIITYDTEYPGYNWNLVKKPSHFTWLEIKTYNPWTSIITCDYELIRNLCRLYPNYQIIC
jgi:hypothetical protein